MGDGVTQAGLCALVAGGARIGRVVLVEFADRRVNAFVRLDGEDVWRSVTLAPGHRKGPKLWKYETLADLVEHAWNYRGKREVYHYEDPELRALGVRF